MGYSYDDILYDQRVQVYVGEEFTEMTNRGDLLCVYVSVDAWITSGSGWGVRSDCYTVTVDPGETACFQLTKVSAGGQGIGMTALTTSPTSNPLDALSGKNQLQTVPGGTFKYLTNTGDTALTWYVTVYVGATTYDFGLSDVGDIQDAFDDSQKTQYQISIFRLDDSIPPEMEGDVVGALRGNCLSVSWAPATDEGSAVVGYEFLLTDGGGNELASGKLSTVTSMSYNNIDLGTYTVSVRAIDLAGNVSDWNSSTLTVDAIEGFCHGYSGATAGTATVILESVALEEGGFYYFSDFSSAKGVSGTIALYSDETGKKVGTATLSKGRISATKDLNLSAGSYTVRLKTSSATGYSFFFEQAQIPAPTDDNDFLRAAALELDAEGRGAVSGYVGYSDAYDYYSIAPDGAGALTLDLTDVRNKLTVTVYNAAGKKLQSKTISGNGTAISELLMTGAGYIAIGSYDKGKGGYNSDYTMSVRQAYFPESENDSFAAPQQALELAGSVEGWVGYGDAQDFFGVSPEMPGRYSLTLSEVRSGTKVKLYRVGADSKGRIKYSYLYSASAGSSGTATLSGKLLDSESRYVAVVEAPNAAKGVSSSYQLSLSGVEFTDANMADDNDWRADALPIFSCEPGNAESGEWVGFGDAVDYRALAVETPGSYTLSLTELQAGAKLTLYRVKTNAKGVQSLTRIASATGGSGKAAVIASRLLDTENEYVLAVTATGAAKGANTSYTLNAAGTQFTSANQVADNDWRAADLPQIAPGDGGIAGEWVGFGDAVDYRQLAVEESGLCTLTLSGLEAGAKIVLYGVKTAKSGATSLKTIKSAAGKAGKDAVIANVDLSDTASYCIGVFATGAKTGKNTSYDLEVSAAEPAELLKSASGLLA